MPKLTTAQYRSRAWAAYENKKFKLAAKYYQAAINVYPKGHSKSQLDRADLKKLRELRDRCKEFARNK